MDNKLAQYIVDILRRKQEEAVLNQGGQVVPRVAQPAPPGIAAALPRGVEPKHGGKTYEELIDSYGAGR